VSSEGLAFSSRFARVSSPTQDYVRQGGLP
jgi:hypothetical protein